MLSIRAVAQTLISASLFVSFSVHAQSVNINQVNKVLKRLSAEALVGETFFYDLSAQVDPQTTDFAAGSAGGTISVGVENTKWSAAKSSLEVNGQILKISEVDQTTKAGVVLGGLLKTEVTALASFAWTASSACQNSGAPDVSAGYYNYIYARICVDVSSSMAALSSFGELMDVVVLALETGKSASSEFIKAKKAELATETDQAKKDAITEDIKSGQQALGVLQAARLVRLNSSLELALTFEGITLKGSMTPDQLNLALSTELTFEKPSFDGYMEAGQNLALQIQAEEPQTLQDLAAQLKSYMDFARDVAQGN